MKGKWIQYSAEEMAWLEANRTLPIGDYHAAFCAAFDRDITAAALHSLRKRKGWKTGRTGHFEKGSAPVNKGVPRAYDANCAATQFKPGHRGGVALDVYKPIGFETIRDGYLVRKINDDMPLQARWRAVHLINWEAINGPLPKGFALKCLDGDTANCDVANWTLVPRAIIPRLNGGPHKSFVAYDTAPAELKPTILAVAQLEHRARTARKAGVPS